MVQAKLGQDDWGSGLMHMKNVTVNYKGDYMNIQRKNLAVPERIHQLMMKHLKMVEDLEGLKISISSFTAQAIREKIARDQL